MSERILPIPVETKLDRRNDTLENFWERMSHGSSNSKEEPIDKVIEIVKKAKDFVCIRTERIISSELIKALREAKERGVRIYGLINKPGKNEYLDSGIFHMLNDDVYSSYILADPNGKKPKGIWISDKVFDVPVGLILNIDTQLVRELWGHFSQEFWESTDEIFFGKFRGKIDVEEQPPKLPGTLSLTSRDFNIPELIDSNVETVVLPESVMELGEDFWNERDWMMYGERIVVPLDELSREFMEYVVEDEKEIIGGSAGFGFVKLRKNSKKTSSFAFMPDMAIKLDGNQRENAEKKAIKSWSWRFERKKRLGDIKEEIIMWDSKWNEDSAIRVEKQSKIELDDVHAETIDDWLNHKELPSPALPENLPLTLDVELSWRILPPYLPEAAKKHVLYQKWNSFQEDLDNAYVNLRKELDAELERKRGMKKRDFKAFEKRVEELKKKLDSVSKEKDGIYGKKSKAEHVLDALKIVKEEFEDVLNTYSKKEKEENDESNELDVIKNKKKKKSKNKIQLPEKNNVPRSLPRTGELYTYKNRDLLTIEFMEEIEPAKKEAKIYNAKVVVQKEAD